MIYLIMTLQGLILASIIKKESKYSKITFIMSGFLIALGLALFLVDTNVL